DDEPARLDAGDLVDLRAGPWLHQLVDRAAERARIAKQRGDVTKDDAGLGIVRDRSDRGAQGVVEHGRGHEGVALGGGGAECITTNGTNNPLPWLWNPALGMGGDGRAQTRFWPGRKDESLLRQPAARRLALVVIGGLENRRCQGRLDVQRAGAAVGKA